MQIFIEWDKITVKGRESGVKKTTCPNCSAERKKKNDPCLYVNFTSGVAKCYNCDALGFRDTNKKDYSEKVYTLPTQDWKNYTELPEKLVKWVEEERKIMQHVLIDMGITYETFYQPAKQKEVGNLVFNYFEGEKLVNKKYRSATKDFTQSAGTKRIFYNINSIIGQDECYIVEGEFDVLAMRQAGIKNVISLPNGANDHDDVWLNCEKYLKDIKKFIIAVDNDEKGNIVKDKIAQRLGRYRCDFIEWENKDANGDLINGVIETTLSNRKKFPVSGTYKVEDLKEDIVALWENGLPETIAPKKECFGKLGQKFSVMRGHLVTGTGIPSHGKSNFSEWYILNLIDEYDMKASFFSPEHSPMELHQANFIQKAIGRSFWKDYPDRPRINRGDIDRYEEWANEKLYLTTAENGEFPTWDWWFEKSKEQIYSFGVDIFVIDAFNKLGLPKGNKLEAINEVLTKLTMFAQMHNVVVFLIAHPTKMGKDEKTGLPAMPSLYNVSGSADFRNQTHDGFCVYRYFGDEMEAGHTSIVNLKTKMSFQGEIGGSEDFEYDVPSGRYFVMGTSCPKFDLTMPKETQIEELPEKKEEAIKPNEDFDNQINWLEYEDNF
jgi:twinkle protein